MPLTANFLADFSSFLGETSKSIAATKDFEAAAATVGPAVDASLNQAGKAAQAAGEHSAKARTDALELGKQIGSSLKNLAGDIAGFASGYIAEFAEAEAATKRLATALKNAGAAPETIAMYSDLATELQKVSRFSDEALMNSMTLFTTVGKIGPESMKATLQATMDLAIGMGIDLPAASKLMIKAAESDGEALGKLKLILGDSIEKGATFAQVVEAINKKFGGQSLADVQSTAGAMENMKNQMSDINEQVGQVFAETLKTLFDWFHSLPESIQTFSIAAVGIGTVLAPVLISLSSLIGLLKTIGLGSLWSAIAAGFGIVIDAIVAFLTFIGPVGWLVLAIGALVAALWVYWDEIVAGVKWLWEKAKYWFSAIVTSVKDMYYGIEFWLKDKLTTLFDFVGETVIPGLVQGFKNARNMIVGFSIVPDMVDEIGREFGRLDRVMVDPAWAAADEATAAFAGIGGATLPTLTAGAARGGGGPINVTVNMSGMFGTDDPQTRALVSDVVSNAVMQGMRSGRLLGTA